MTWFLSLSDAALALAIWLLWLSNKRRQDAANEALKAAVRGVLRLQRKDRRELRRRLDAAVGLGLHAHRRIDELTEDEDEEPEVVCECVACAKWKVERWN